jgi:hypothetical protein
MNWLIFAVAAFAGWNVKRVIRTWWRWYRDGIHEWSRIDLFLNVAWPAAIVYLIYAAL